MATSIIPNHQQSMTSKTYSTAFGTMTAYRIGKMVFFTMTAATNATVVEQTWYTATTLDAEYRPKDGVYIHGYDNNLNADNGARIVIDTNGKVTVWCEAGATNCSLRFSACYIALN